MIYDDRKIREAQEPGAPWSSRPAYRPDPHPLYDDGAFISLGVLLNIVGLVAVTYFAVHVLCALFVR